MTEVLRTAHFGELDLEQFGAIVAPASDGELAALMSDPATRKRILDFLYEESVAMLCPEPLDVNDVVIHWHVSGAPIGGCDSFQLLIDDGVALPSRCLTRLPRCSFEIGPVDLLRKVAGQATMTGLRFEGRAIISGDMSFASQVEELFR
jgi:hypothetical protein